MTDTHHIANEGSRAAWFKVGLIALYALGVGLTLASHAMWRDEIQAWLIARDSATVTALLKNLSYEGHPALWYLLLMPLTRLSRDPFLMQILHWGIATATVALVLWRAPLSRLEQVLFPFGYFFFFEYAAKSRSYVVGVFLVMAFCALWRHRRQHPVLTAIVIALMANVHVLTMIVSMAACLALACDRMVDSRPSEERVAGWRWDVLACIVVFAGWSAAAYTALPPPDSGFAAQWFLTFSPERLQTTFLSLSALLMPSNAAAAVVAAGLAAAAFLWICTRIKRNPAASVFLGASVLGLLVFFYTKYPGYYWHHGLIFVAFFAAVWIDREGGPQPVSDHSLVPAWIFAAVLGCQAVFGLKAAWDDMHRPLSNGREVARFIASNGWASDPIVGIADNTVSTVVGYLGANRIYYANGRRWGSFVKWDKSRAEPVDMDAVLGDIPQPLRGATLIVSADTRVDPAILTKHRFSEVAQFKGAAWDDENYTIYRRRVGNDTPAR